MRQMAIGVLIVGAMLGVPASTGAQERQPHAGLTAAGIDVGAFIPTADGLSNSLLLNVLYEEPHDAQGERPRRLRMVESGLHRWGVYLLREYLSGSMSTTTGREGSGIPSSARAWVSTSCSSGSTRKPSAKRETRFGLNTGGGIDALCSIRPWRSRGKDAITPSATWAGWIPQVSRSRWG